MRKSLAVLAAVPTFMFAASAHADTLPSLTVPTFSLQYTGYEGWNNLTSDSYPAAAHVVSTNASATVIGLDSHASQLQQTVTSTRGAWPTEVFSTMRFEAAEGYRITSVVFSATVSATTTPPEVPEGAVVVDPHTWNSYAWSYLLIRPVGSTALPTAGSRRENFLEPVDLVASEQNSADLRSFDLYSQIGASAAVWGTSYQLPGVQDIFKTYGTTTVSYLNPTLTVYTALAPVPEPGTWAMLGAGLAVIGATRRRKSA